VSCVKTAEPIEMQFGIPSRVVSGNMLYMGMLKPLQQGQLLAGSGQLILGLDKRMSCVKNGWTGLNDY